MPRVAVCVCTASRPEMLDHTLQVLERIEPGGLNPHELVLVVVDNRPTGAARDVCAQRASHLPMRLQFVEEPEAGISFARNRAVHEALAMGCELVAFIDDDDEPMPDWLARLLERQQETRADLVFGTWRLPDHLAVPRWLRSLRYFDPPRLDSVNRFDLPAWAGTFNVLLSRRMLEQIGAQGPIFRPELALTGGSDTEFFIRACRAGYPYAVAPDSVVIRVWEPSRMTLRGLLQRSFRLGGTRYHINRLHLPAERVRRQRQRALLKLLKAFAFLPVKVTLRKEGPARALMKLAEALGEANAALGRRYSYYATATAAGTTDRRRRIA